MSDAPESDLAQRLRSLPPLQAPAGGWARLRAARLRQRVRRVAVPLAAAAALAALALAWPRAGREPAFTPSLSRGDEELSLLIRRSQALEEELRASPSSAAADVRQIDEEAELEDQLAWIDRSLARDNPAERTALWTARIRLLDAYLELRRPPTAWVSL